MSFLDYFSDWMNKTLTVLEYDSGYNETTGDFGDPSWSAADPAVTVVCGVWDKSAVEAYTSEQFREEIDEVCVTAVVDTIPSDCRLTDGTLTWSVGARIDVAHQGEVYLVGMKRI